MDERPPPFAGGRDPWLIVAAEAEHSVLVRSYDAAWANDMVTFIESARARTLKRPGTACSLLDPDWALVSPDDHTAGSPFRSWSERVLDAGGWTARAGLGDDPRRLAQAQPVSATLRYFNRADEPDEVRWHVSAGLSGTPSIALPPSDVLLMALRVVLDDGVAPLVRRLITEDPLTGAEVVALGVPTAGYEPSVRKVAHLMAPDDFTPLLDHEDIPRALRQRLITRLGQARRRSG